MTTPRIRVLVVDDSAFARKVLVEILKRESDIEVVGIARDGLDALEQTSELQPDVLTLDLMMPGLDGLGVLRSLPLEDPPRVVVVSSSDADTERGLSALDAGAVELVHKPTALASSRALRALNPSRLAVGHGVVIEHPAEAMDRAIATAEQKLSGTVRHAS